MIKIMDKDIKNIYFQGKEIKAVYFMNKQIWPSATNKIEYSHNFIKMTGDWYHTSPTIFIIPENGNYKFDFILTVIATETCSENPLFEFFPNFVDGQPNNGISIAPWNTTSFYAGQELTTQQSKILYALKGQQYNITMKTQNDTYSGTMSFKFSATWEYLG